MHACVYMHACAYMYCCNLCVEVKERTVGVSSLLPAFLGPRSHWVPRLIVKVFITRAISLALSYGFLIANFHNYVNQFYSPHTHTSVLKRTLTLSKWRNSSKENVSISRFCVEATSHELYSFYQECVIIFQIFLNLKHVCHWLTRPNLTIYTH